MRVSPPIQRFISPRRIMAHNSPGPPRPPEEMPVTPMPFRELIEEFMEGYEPPARARTTCRLMRQSVRELAEDDRIATSADLSPAAIWRWLRRHPDRTAITSAVHLRNLRVLANYAVG